MSKDEEVVADNQSWFWTPEWQQGEREASDDIREGRLSPAFHSMEEIEEYLSNAQRSC